VQEGGRGEGREGGGGMNISIFRNACHHPSFPIAHPNYQYKPSRRGKAPAVGTLAWWDQVDVRDDGSYQATVNKDSGCGERDDRGYGDRSRDWPRDRGARNRDDDSGGHANDGDRYSMFSSSSSSLDYSRSPCQSHAPRTHHDRRREDHLGNGEPQYQRWATTHTRDSSSHRLPHTHEPQTEWNSHRQRVEFTSQAPPIPDGSQWHGAHQYASSWSTSPSRRVERHNELQNNISTMTAAPAATTMPCASRKAERHREHLYMTSQVVCHFHARGCCKQGAACRFYHGGKAKKRSSSSPSLGAAPSSKLPATLLVGRSCSVSATSSSKITSAPPVAPLMACGGAHDAVRTVAGPSQPHGKHAAPSKMAPSSSKPATSKLASRTRLSDQKRGKQRATKGAALQRTLQSQQKHGQGKGKRAGLQDSGGKGAATANGSNCRDGKHCTNYHCQHVHPTSRLRTCHYVETTAGCTDSKCSYLHPMGYHAARKAGAGPSQLHRKHAASSSKIMSSSSSASKPTTSKMSRLGPIGLLKLKEAKAPAAAAAEERTAVHSLPLAAPAPPPATVPTPPTRVEGFEKMWDHRTGEHYYYNATTGVTQWDPPLELESTAAVTGAATILAPKGGEVNVIPSEDEDANVVERRRNSATAAPSDRGSSEGEALSPHPFYLPHISSVPPPPPPTHTHTHFSPCSLLIVHPFYPPPHISSHCAPLPPPQVVRPTWPPCTTWPSLSKAEVSWQRQR
jgi:hypothetical protein